MMDGSLVLMQQCDGVDQREVFDVIAAEACFGIGERELRRVRITDSERLD